MNNELKELQDVSTAKSHAEINNFEFLPESTHLKKRKYGNLIILLKTDKFFITLGPDCIILNHYRSLSHLCPPIIPHPLYIHHQTYFQQQ